MSTKILVVDDEISLLSRVINQSFDAQIRDQKYQFYFARDGQEAWEQIQDSSPDLMLLDLRMPNLDGFSLLRRLNQNNFNIKTIIISAYGTIENFKSAMRERAFDFLIKPLNRQELKEVVEKVLASHAQNQWVRINKFSSTETVKNYKVHFNTVLGLARSLPPSQQHKLVSSLVENFSLDQLEDLQDDLPSLKLLASEDEEEREQLEAEDREREIQGKIPLYLLEEGYLEEREQKYTKKGSGEEIFYKYLFLRWIDPKTKRLRGRAIKKKDLEEPQVRRIIERKLGKSLSL